MGICPERSSLVTRYSGPTLKEQLPSFSSEHKASIAAQLTQTVQAIHAKGISHRDLKASNVCVDASQGHPEVTVIDFGICSH